MMTATQAWLEYKYDLKSPTDETVCVPFSIYDIPKHISPGMRIAVPRGSTIAEVFNKNVRKDIIIICDQCRAQCRDGDKYCSNCGFCLRCD